MVGLAAIAILLGWAVLQETPPLLALAGGAIPIAAAQQEGLGSFLGLAAAMGALALLIVEWVSYHRRWTT